MTRIAGDPGVMAWAAGVDTSIAAKLDTAAAAIAYSTPTQVAAAVAAGSLIGTYAARPLASAVPSGTIYYTTNVPEQYRSNGAAWVVTGSGGNELGYAESTAMFSTTSTVAVDVTGMTVAFVAGERPVLVILRADLAHSTGTETATAQIVVNSVVRARCVTFPAAAADMWGTHHREARVSGLTPGVTYTAKIQVFSSVGTSTARIVGDVTNPMSISVVTL